MKIWNTVIAVQVLAHALGQASMDLVSFQLIDSPVDKSTLTPGWRAPSFAKCAISCIQMAAPCYSFKYDEATSICTPGVWIINGTASVSHRGSFLFSSIVCSNPKYTLHMRMGVAMCLHVSRDKLNYTNAKLACEDEGSHLLTLKTQDKLDLFGIATKPKTEQLWVGLDDMETEGVYKWVDDGTVVPRDFWNMLFGKYQPDNRFSKEDCCVYDVIYSPLNDEECDKELRYFCEALPTILSIHDAT